jgi:hypothetical protein
MWKIVIQDSHSFCYLLDGGVWSYDAIAARSFPRVAEAAEHCAVEGLKSVYIVTGKIGADGRFDSAVKTIMRPPRLH